MAILGSSASADVFYRLSLPVVISAHSPDPQDIPEIALVVLKCVCATKRCMVDHFSKEPSLMFVTFFFKLLEILVS